MSNKYDSIIDTIKDIKEELTALRLLIEQAYICIEDDILNTKDKALDTKDE